MKRIKIVLIIMAVLVAGAIGIYFIAQHFSDKNQKEITEKANELVIFDFDYNDVTKLKIHNESGDYEMQYTEENNWEMAGEIDFEPNSYSAVYICSIMSNLTAQKIINNSDKSKFGFDNSVDLTVTCDGKDYTLHIGDPSPTKESFYVMKEGSDNIYLISYQNGEVLRINRDALKDPHIADMFSSEVEHFAFWKGAETDENILFSMNKNSDGLWSMVKPYNDVEVNNANVTEYLDSITSDEIFQFVEENCPESDYSKYGFDNPTYVFEISDGKKHKKVIFGNDTDNGEEIYGLFTGNGQVVTLKKNGIMILGYTTIDMLTKTISNKTLNEIRSVNVKTPDFEAAVEMDSENEKYKINGIDISSEDSDKISAYFTFIDSFNGAYFSEIDKTAVPSDEAELTITYDLSDGTKKVIEYVSSENNDSYWVVIDGEYTGFIVKKKVVENIYSTYEELEKLII